MRNFLTLLLILLLTGCALEEAHPQRQSQLIIAQNFMSAAQKKILTKIAKRRSINLTILDLNSGNMRKALKRQPWEPGFDLIVLDGIAALKNLEGLSFQYHQPNFAAIPIGISFVQDSVVSIRHFKDLSSRYLWAAADAKSETVLKAHLAYAYRERKTNKQLNKVYKDLMRGFNDYKLAFDTYQLQNTLLLCRYDTHLHVLKKAVKKRKFTYALDKKNRYFADYMSLSIIEQTPNYVAAQKFVAFLNYMRDHNAAFRNAFGVRPTQTSVIQPTPKVLLDFLEK